MTEQLVIAPFAAALVTAIATLLTRKKVKLQKLLGATGIIAYSITALTLASKVIGGEILTYQLSNWPAPYGITFVADALTGFMLALTVTVAVPALLYSFYYMKDFEHGISFQPLFHFMLLGVTGAFLTGDVFNLFVWFEVMLMSSYILVLFYGRKEHTEAALKYVVINLIGSAFMLVAIGGLYATTGTLNMADMAARLAEPAAYNVAVAPVLGLAGILFCVFALKAGIAPFQFWVPEAYRAAPAPVSAMLAGAAKKVGIYAIIRLYFTVFSAATLNVNLFGITGNSFNAVLGPIMLLMASASILVGGLGAVSRERLDDLLSYSSIGQAGFIVLPLGIAAVMPEIAPIAIAAALVYALNHTIAKSMLFMASGVIKRKTGTDRFEEVGGLAENSYMLSGAFLLGALSLIGVPPLLGFFGKMLVFSTAVNMLPFLGIALIGGLLTIVYFSKAWNELFWGEPVEIVEGKEINRQTLIIGLMALMLIATGVGFETIIQAAQSAADAALAQQHYIDAVIKTTAEANQTVSNGGGSH